MLPIAAWCARMGAELVAQSAGERLDFRLRDFASEGGRPFAPTRVINSATNSAQPAALSSARELPLTVL